MLNFCHRTDLRLIDDKIKAAVLDYARSSSGVATSYHDFPIRQKQGPGTFVFYKLDPDLQSQILSNLPQELQEHDPFIRIQITTGSGAMAHIDKGRKSGIFILLTNDRSETKFYDWKLGAEKNLLHEMIVDPEEITEKMTVTFGEDECWLFNHASIHSIKDVNDTRISLNILFKDLEYDALLAQYLKSRVI